MDNDLKRNWVLCCEDGTGDVGTCGIEVEDETLLITAPPDATAFRLNQAEVAAFRGALDEAAATLRARARRVVYCRDTYNRPQWISVDRRSGEILLSLVPNETSRLRPIEARWLAEALLRHYTVNDSTVDA